MNLWKGDGRLVKDCDLKYTASGWAIITFGIAVWRGKQKKEGAQDTDFINVKWIGRDIDDKAGVLRKGTKVKVEGKLHIDRYESNGEKKQYTYILANKVEIDGEAKPQSAQQNKLADNTDGINLEDLPF